MRALAIESGSWTIDVRAVLLGADETDGLHAATTLLRRRRRGGRRGGQPGLGEIGRVGEAGGLAGDDADPGAAVAAAGDLLDATVVETGRRRPFVFGVHLGEVGTGGGGTGEHAFQDVLVDHPPQPTKANAVLLVVRCWRASMSTWGRREHDTPRHC